MKVIIAIPCLLRGGTEMQTLMQVRALIECGYTVSVCCYFETDAFVVKELEALGAKVNLLRLSRYIKKIKLIRVLAKAFRQFAPDVVHVQYMAPGLLPIIAARLAGFNKVLATVHYPATPHGAKAKFLLWLGAFLCRHVICVSEACERSWFGTSRLLAPRNPESSLGRHFTIPNAVDTRQIDIILSGADNAELKKDLGLDGHPVIGTVARLSHEKGVDVLLDAFAGLRRVHPEVRLLIVGDGFLRQPLQARAEKLGTADAIIWTGRQSWERAIKLLGIMDVVVVPSRFEGFGLTAIEAMARGKPVVASRVGGLMEVLRDRWTGMLVSPENPIALAAAVISLLADKDLREKMGKAGRSRVEKNYDYPEFKDRYQLLYNKIL